MRRMGMEYKLKRDAAKVAAGTMMIEAARDERHLMTRTAAARRN